MVRGVILARGIVSLKVTLLGSAKPPIWRRLHVRGNFSLLHLHVAIQAAMGWEESHMHDFRIGDVRYGNRAQTDEVEDEERIALNQLIKMGVRNFVYTYDFGDDWEHRVVLEKPPPAVAGRVYPACVAGKGRCPPEDCGGIWGYYGLLEILADPSHPEYGDRREWFEGELDPAAFSVAEADAALEARFSRML